MNRAERRAMERSARQAPRRPPAHAVRHEKAAKSRTLATAPWRIELALGPLRRILDQIAEDGTVEHYRGRPVFREAETGTWFETVPALAGVLDFHRLAAKRRGVTLDLSPLERLAAKLERCSPLFPTEVEAARDCLSMLAAFDSHLTVGEAVDAVKTVQIAAEFEKERAHAVA